MEDMTFNGRQPLPEIEDYLGSMTSIDGRQRSKERLSVAKLSLAQLSPSLFSVFQRKAGHGQGRIPRQCSYSFTCKETGNPGEDPGVGEI